MPIGEENIVSQDNLWFNSAQHSQIYHSDDDEVFEIFFYFH